MKRLLLAPVLWFAAATSYAQGSAGAADEWDAIMQLAPAAKGPGEAQEEPARNRKPERERREKKRGGERARAEGAGYEALKKSWHEPWPEADPVPVNGGAPSMTLHPVGRAAPVTIAPNNTGGFDAEQLESASIALGSWQGGPIVAERLVGLIYEAAKHFETFHVHVVSGVRRDRSGSRHSHALAADIVLPGIEDEELAAFFRAQGFVGVGVYTRAGFVHIDVRERSYFWIDRSPPGRRYKIQQVRADEAKAADEAAVARGQQGYVNPVRLNKALAARAKKRRATRQGREQAAR